MAAPTCPCGSGVVDAKCCRPFLRGVVEAPTPVALMRSRYTAFATGDVEYLWRTLDASHVGRASRSKDDVLRSLSDTCRRVRFLGLRVLDNDDGDDDDDDDGAGFARVLFSVRAFEKGRDRSFHELSRFNHDGAGWRYVGGELREGAAADGLTIATW